MGGCRIYMADCENQLLREIAEPAMKRLDIAQSYRLAIIAWGVAGERIDWRKVNEAIIARWSRHALEWIKTQALSGKPLLHRATGASLFKAAVEDVMRGP